MTVVGGFEGCRCREAGAGFDLAVKASVVEPVDVGECGELDVVEAALGAFRVDELPLVERVERFGHRVIEAVALGSDRRDDGVVGESLGVANAEILDSAVAVMRQLRQIRALAATVEHGHLECVDRQIAAQRPRGLPADDHARVDVDDERDVDPTRVCFDVGQVGDPQPVRCRRPKLALDQIGRPVEPVIALGRACAAEADLMRQYAGGRGCLMEFLQRSLDDPDPGPCGKCSVCTGVAPGPGSRADRKWLQLASQYSRGLDNVIETRQRWPSGSIHRIPIHGVRAGRAVAFADDPAWSDELSRMRRSGYRAIPAELLRGAIDVLTRWSKVWGERPTWVMAAPAHGVHAEANRAVAEHVAAVGKRPLVDIFEWNGGPLPQNAPSGPVVDHLDSVLRVREGVALPDGPVLVCSAIIQTRWTATVVGRMLNELDKGPVLPFALHQLP